MGFSCLQIRLMGLRAKYSAAVVAYHGAVGELEMGTRRAKTRERCPFQVRLHPYK